jgi:hypothetical protein
VNTKVRVRPKQRIVLVKCRGSGELASEPLAHSIHYESFLPVWAGFSPAAS